MRRRDVGRILLAVGAVMTVVGVVGAITAGGSSSASKVASTATTTTAVPATTIAAPTTTTTVAPETPEQFLPRLTAALRSGDATTLFSLLHPAVIDLYGADQCRATMTKLKDDTAAFVIHRTEGPGPFNWPPDGRSIPVSDVLTVNVDRTAGGVTSTADVHLGRVGSELRFFSDCGTPLPGK